MRGRKSNYVGAIGKLTTRQRDGALLRIHGVQAAFIPDICLGNKADFRAQLRQSPAHLGYASLYLTHSEMQTIIIRCLPTARGVAIVHKFLAKANNCSERDDNDFSMVSALHFSSLFCSVFFSVLTRNYFQVSRRFCGQSPISRTRFIILRFRTSVPNSFPMSVEQHTRP